MKASQLTNGYYHSACSTDAPLPNGAVRCEPPSLIELDKAYKFDCENNCWIIEDDPKGLNVPLIDFNELPQKQFEHFNDELHLPIKRRFTLIPIRFLGFDSYYEILEGQNSKTRNRFQISTVQNRLAQLVDNATLLANQVYSTYLYAQNDAIPVKGWAKIHFSTKFGMEQSTYCMKLCFDTLIQLANCSIKQEKCAFNGEIKPDSLGTYLQGMRKECEKCEDIHQKIFSQLEEEHRSFLDALNNIANSYKHSFLQGIAEQLYGEGEPTIIAVHAKNNKLLILKDNNASGGVTIWNIPFRQVVLGFFSTLEAVMDSIKARLPEEALPVLNQREQMAKQTSFF